MRSSVCRTLVLVLGGAAFSGSAFAGSIQLTTASALPAGTSTITFPTSSPGSLSSAPVSFSAGGNTLTFSDAGGAFEYDVAGSNYFETGFPTGTGILYAEGFTGSGAPVTINFLDPATAFGFDAEEFNFGQENFTYTIFDGTHKLGTYKVQGNDPNSLAFIGAEATGGSVITSLVLVDAEGNDIGLGPVEFATATPEPGTFALLGTGLAGLLGLRRRWAR